MAVTLLNAEGVPPGLQAASDPLHTDARAVQNLTFIDFDSHQAFLGAMANTDTPGESITVNFYAKVTPVGTFPTLRQLIPIGTIRKTVDTIDAAFWLQQERALQPGAFDPKTLVVAMAWTGTRPLRIDYDAPYVSYTWMYAGLDGVC